MGQNTNINLGRKGQFGSVNLDALKGGIKKADVQSAEQIKLFDKFDLDKNGILTQDEIQNLVDSLGGYAQDGEMSNRGSKKILKENGLNRQVTNKDVFGLLTQLGVSSENIVDTTYSMWPDDNISTINIEYKPAPDGSIVKEYLNEENGALHCKETKNNGKILTQYFDENGNISIKSVNVDELSGKLKANLYEKLKELLSNVRVAIEVSFKRGSSFRDDINPELLSALDMKHSDGTPTLQKVMLML